MFILLPFLITLHILICILIVLVVLMQRPRSEGLGAAFGGGMTENMFGAQTTNVLVKFTSWLAVVFFAITLLLSIITARIAGGKTAIQESLLNSPVPAAAPTASGTPAAPPAAPVATPAASPAN
ncbi:MAG: preprotein translocase subunit SecG [Verrucomicrobiae bacterium]